MRGMSWSREHAPRCAAIAHAQSGPLICSGAESILWNMPPAAGRRIRFDELERAMECAAPAALSRAERLFSQKQRDAVLPDVPQSARAAEARGGVLFGEMRGLSCG